MTWDTLRDQVRTPSSRQTEPLRPSVKKRPREQSGGEEAEEGLEGRRGGRGGRAVRRYAA